MNTHSVPVAARAERRRSHRVRLNVPVELSQEAHGLAQNTKSARVSSVDLSTAGAYVTVPEGHAFALGQTLLVSLVIPEAVRRTFPFSRIVGPGCVVRADEQGIALAFCEDQTICLGAIVFQE